MRVSLCPELVKDSKEAPKTGPFYEHKRRIGTELAPDLAEHFLDCLGGARVRALE